VEGKRGYRVKADTAIADVDPAEYDVLVIPGGRAPERVRLEEGALRAVRHFFQEGKPVAVICHGPQVLISAGVVRGRRLTSWWGIKDDVIAAGGVWVDEPVVVDGNLVSSRYPPDIPLWMREFMRLLEARGLLRPTPPAKA
jgi:protease I